MELLSTAMGNKSPGGMDLAWWSQQRRTILMNKISVTVDPDSTILQDKEPPLQPRQNKMFPVDRERRGLAIELDCRSPPYTARKGQNTEGLDETPHRPEHIGVLHQRQLHN